MSNTEVLLQTQCPDLNLVARGKVRDVYAVPENDDVLLFVATDRVSAFDVIMKNGIANKGKLLTAISLFFFDLLSKDEKTKDIPNHVITSDISKMPPSVQKYADQLKGRSILVKKCNIVPIEAIVRGYLTGSAYSSYKKDGTMNGIKLPKGLQESSKFPEPIYTPSTKAEIGDHDENIHPDQVEAHLPDDQKKFAKPLSDDAVALFQVASDYAQTRGLLLADTKFEFGVRDGQLVLADEVLTPDSSRFWDAHEYAVGKKMTGFDKQYLREWLNTKESGFDGDKGIEMPENVRNATFDRYCQVYERLTGKKFEP